MTTNEFTQVLLWCAAINYGILFLWLGVFVFAHDWMFRLHTRWFKLSVEIFDAINYAAIAAYKLAIILLNLTPLLALLLAA
jgi:hypothetical protein